MIFSVKCVIRCVSLWRADVHLHAVMHRTDMAMEAKIIHLIWICTSVANAQQGNHFSAWGFTYFECLITFYSGTLDATNKPVSFHNVYVLYDDVSSSEDLLLDCMYITSK